MDVDWPTVNRLLDQLDEGLRRLHASVDRCEQIISGTPPACPDHGPTDGGRCYECEHNELIVDTEIERRVFG